MGVFLLEIFQEVWLSFGFEFVGTDGALWSPSRIIGNYLIYRGK